MEKIKEQIKKLGQSKILLKLLYILGILIIAKIIFFAGIVVGFHKASYGNAWGEHYNENFGMGNRDGAFGMMDRINMMDRFPNAHGATGKIIKIEAPKIIVQDNDHTEKIVLIQSNTEIERGRFEIKVEDLKVDDFIVVLGTPDDTGVIDAKLIRVIPSPEFLK